MCFGWMSVVLVRPAGKNPSWMKQQTPVYCLLAAFINYWLYFAFWVQSELLTDDCMRPRCNESWLHSLRTAVEASWASGREARKMSGNSLFWPTLGSLLGSREKWLRVARSSTKSEFRSIKGATWDHRDFIDAFNKKGKPRVPRGGVAISEKSKKWQMTGTARLLGADNRGKCDCRRRWREERESRRKRDAFTFLNSLHSLFFVL